MRAHQLAPHGVVNLVDELLGGELADGRTEV
jgi:hypothetical protein